jgi:2-keto-4-pentenoate hydratase/2-oxohepta-3-ene-1,7-dioic acid hydratase in catechol pathway
LAISTVAGERRAYFLSGNTTTDAEHVADGQAAHGTRVTGALGSALHAWSAHREAIEKSFATASPASAKASEWQRPLDDHAKILIVGGHRYADPPAVPAARPPAALKFPTSFALPDQPLRLPQGKFEADVALGFVIGQDGTRISASAARAAIAGYILMADVTEADDYREEARTNNGLVAKNYAGLSSLSPIVSLAGRENFADFDLWLKVDGIARQEMRLSELLYSVEESIAAWSLTTLLPGDVVALGAAAARHRIAPVPLAAGNELEIGCTQLGSIRHRIVAER